MPYVDKLQQTLSAKKGLYIGLREIGLKRNWRLKKIPRMALPLPDDNRHVIILEMSKDIPQRTTVLTKPEQKFTVESKKCDKLLVLLMPINPLAFVIISPTNGFLIQGGQKIDVVFKILYQVQDVGQFWFTSLNPLDPLQELETQALAHTKAFFQSIPAEALLVTPPELLQRIQAERYTEGLRRVKNELERNLKRLVVHGLQVQEVQTEIFLTGGLRKELDQLQETHYQTDKFLEGIYARETELAYRRYIDTLIDEDCTFGRGKLRQVVLLLKPQLLEKLYSQEPWSTTIFEILQSVNDLKQELVRAQNPNEFERLIKQIQLARTTGIKEEILQELQKQLVDKFQKEAEPPKHLRPSPNQDLYRVITGLIDSSPA